MRTAVASLIILLALIAAAGARPAGCPSAWCGCWMRHQMPVDPGPQFNLAQRWANYGTDAAGPTVGAIVVWAYDRIHGHVGRIVGKSGNCWLVQSGNDGHQVRTRCRSIAGAIAFRMPPDRAIAVASVARHNLRTKSDSAQVNAHYAASERGSAI